MSLLQVKDHNSSRVPVAHACSHSCSNQEYHGSKPAEAVFTRPYLEKTLYKNRAGVVAQAPVSQKINKRSQFKVQNLKYGSYCLLTVPIIIKEKSNHHKSGLSV
jgi:hypothetical protein